MKYVFFYSFLMIVLFYSCTKPPTDYDEKSYIKFEYNDSIYYFSNSSTHAVWFSEKTQTEDFLIAGYNQMQNQAFGIIINKDVEAGIVYDIFSSSNDQLIPDIWIKFDTVSSIQLTENKVKRIGEIEFTRKTKNIIGGTFRCELNQGYISNGEFQIKNIVLNNL
ncbi:hypothetical protein D0T49_08110 [Paludibacter sp. 221]|uniref:hypothetical protein n=1 Tax=Paludibacter sp. 221 TaxID=2302939 RepID=UPI0013D783A2|nr:hypothetical protein [Paludibacter sp. 221]NDV47010.1 hypothetical protein [Paludibacter sp. 221]